MKDTAGTGEAFERLVGIMARLRGPDGCPWDRQQTHESLKEYVVEETAELVDAIEDGDPDEICSELGDLMLQILFHAQIASENEAFCIDDVIEGISSKLIRRHPHVFGEAEVASPEEVLHRWREIKSREKGFEKRHSVLDGVPKSLPVLARAMEISKRAAGAGFEWPDLQAVFAKLEEEVVELKEEIGHRDKQRISEEIGDLLFTVVNVARWTDVDPVDSLQAMLRRFSERFRQIEKTASDQGRSLESLSMEEMDEVWDQAKGKRPTRDAE